MISLHGTWQYALDSVKPYEGSYWLKMVAGIWLVVGSGFFGGFYQFEAKSRHFRVFLKGDRFLFRSGFNQCQ